MLLKAGTSIPLKYLPYMQDYSKVWTDEDYCTFYDLSAEQSEFMCRTVEDYRIKDYLDYIDLNNDFEE